MKQAVLVAPKRSQLTDASFPEVGPDTVVVRVRAS